MKKRPDDGPVPIVVIWIMIAVMAVAAVACNGCGPGCGRNQPTDACGGSGSHPVTIGGVMVVGCK